MQKTTIFKYFLGGFIFVSSFFCNLINAQDVILGAPAPLAPPEGWTQICASDDFNFFEIQFTINPVSNLNSDNEFIIEMSDPTGDFSTPIEVGRSMPGAVNASPALIPLSVPENTAGDNYRFRVRSTSPESVSAPSLNSYTAYFLLQNEPFTINNFNPTGTFCPGGSYLLTIDNPSLSPNISPAQFDSLTFNWYRRTGPGTSELILAAGGPSISITVEGTYFVETNYGSCPSNSISNEVTLTADATGNTTTTIISSLGNPFCSADGSTTLSTSQGDSYQWFLDGTAIPNATNATYITNISGSYSVIVNTGGCQATGTIELESENFISQINIPEINFIPEGASLEVIITTNAINPSFEWYLNENLIESETQNTLIATEFGSYRVVINQNASCMLSQQFTFRIDEEDPPPPPPPNVPLIPNIISPNGDTINDNWVIPQIYASGTDTNIMIFSSQGEVVLDTNDYQQNWPEDQLELTSVNKVFYYIITTTDQQTKKGSITVVK